MKRLLLLFCWMAYFTCAGAQEVTWVPGSGPLPVAQYMQVMEDTTCTLRIQDVRTDAYKSRFLPSGQDVLHFGFTDKVIWLRLQVHNETADQLLLAFQQAFVSEAVMYYTDSSGGWQQISSGYNVPLMDKPVVGHDQVLPVPATTGPLYIRLRPLIHAIPVELVKKEYWEVKAAQQKMNYGIYAGILLFAVIVNVFLFITLKKKYFLYYAILIFFYLLTAALVMEGFAIYFFPGIPLMFWYKIVPVLDMPALLFYCISFFELKKDHPRMYRLALRSALFFCVYLLFVPFLPLLPVLLANQVFALYVFVIGIFVGMSVGKSGNRLGYYFALFYSLWFLLILVEAVYIQTGAPQHIFPVSFVSTAIFMEAFLLASLVAKRFQWEKRADHLRQFELKSRMERMEQNFKQEMLTTRLEIQEETFNAISQEIHDNVGQLLSLARIQVNIMDQQDGKDPQMIAELRGNLGQAMNDLRNIAKSLSSHYIQTSGLGETVATQVQQINRIGFTNIQLNVSGIECPIDSQRKLILYRIIQEGIQNAIKHARAKDVNILLDYSGSRFCVEIADNGIGFDSAAILHQHAGLGLQNLITRASLIGGEASIHSLPGQGTTIRIVTPYQ